MFCLSSAAAAYRSRLRFALLLFEVVNDEEEEEDEEDEEDVLNRPITDDSFVGTGPVDNVVNPAINSGYSDYDSDDSDFSNMSQFEPAE